MTDNIDFFFLRDLCEINTKNSFQHTKEPHCTYIYNQIVHI